VKQRYRYDYRRLATALAERPGGQLTEAGLGAALAGPEAFPWAVLAGGGISDWELSQVVCEVYGLPFLPVDRAQPDPALVAELMAAGIGPFLRRTGLVPLAKNGSLLAVAMPALVPAEILDELQRVTGLIPAPVVGTVQTNERWLEEHVPGEAPFPAPPEAEAKDPPAALPRAADGGAGQELRRPPQAHGPRGQEQ
jgi:hypothetical protein